MLRFPAMHAWLVLLRCLTCLCFVVYLRRKSRGHGGMTSANPSSDSDGICRGFYKDSCTHCLHGCGFRCRRWGPLYTSETRLLAPSNSTKDSVLNPYIASVAVTEV